MACAALSRPWPGLFTLGDRLVAAPAAHELKGFYIFCWFDNIERFGDIKTSLITI